MQKKFWTDDQDAALTAYINAGKLSFAGMAAAINREFGTAYSRNSAIGRASRLGLTSKKPPHLIGDVIRKPRAKKSTANTGQHHIVTRIVSANSFGGLRVQQSTAREEYKLRCVEIVPLNLTLADLPDNGCRYIPGDDLLYCGHPIKEGSSYCTPHHFLCWAPAKPSLPRARIYQGTDFSRGAA